MIESESFPAIPCRWCPAKHLPCLAQVRHHARFCHHARVHAEGTDDAEAARTAARFVDLLATTAPEPAPSPVAPPGLVTKARNLARAIVAHAVAGFPEATDETAQARLAICRECPDLDAAAMTCNLCGCGLDVKVRWSEQRCPAGKWGAEASPRPSPIEGP